MILGEIFAENHEIITNFVKAVSPKAFKTTILNVV